MSKRLTRAQTEELRWFVEVGKARATERWFSGLDGDERTFYQRIIDRADALLPLLRGSVEVETETEEEPDE